MMDSKETKFKIILCVDMDAFYAQCESIRLGIDPSLPLAVRQWDTLVSVNYAARLQGVSKIATCKDALQSCPELQMIHVDTIQIDEQGNETRSTIEDKFKRHDKAKEKISLDYYRSESVKLSETFSKFCKNVERASIDEVFLDLTDDVKKALESFEDSKEWDAEWKGVVAGGEPFIPDSSLEKGLMIAAEMADKIRREITETFKYTCSAGISYNKMLAKLASGLNKPDKQTVITPRYGITALEKLEVKKVKNFGGKISTVAKEHNIKTLGELQALSLKELAHIFKAEETAKYIYFRCRGYDEELVQEKKIDHKSLAASKTFNAITDMKTLRNIGELIVADLNSKIIEFYEETGNIPQTVTLGYLDKTLKSHKSKSLSINMFIPKSQFRALLISKYNELVDSVEKIVFPCTGIGLSVRSFIKNDLKEYKFSVDAFFKPKQCSESKDATPGKSDLSLRKEDTLDLVNLADGETIAEPVDQELSTCEKCGKGVPIQDLESHMDFHMAEDLDREVNPHKRKYNPKRNFSEFQKENQNTPVSGSKESAKSVQVSPLTKMLKTSKDKSSVKSDSGNNRISIKPIQSYFKKP